MNRNTSLHFYFHDYETFGIDPAHDRPAQFAGLRTDADFNLVGEPFVLYCKPPLDYLPNPEAVLITGITPQEALKQGYCEAEFASQIHHAFSQSGNCIVGYNNIRFDDEVTRHLFYRNFYPPYDYSWQNGNSRWDLLDVVRTYYAIRPEGIHWPCGENGLPSFRLEHLTAANDLAHIHAHDALSDVYATLSVAKMLKSTQPRLFEYLFQLRHKSHVRSHMNTLTLTPLVHISGMLGAYRGNTSWIVPLAWHPENRNAIIVCDLMGIIESLLECDSETLRHRLYTRHDEFPDESMRIPLKLIHTNRCPIILPAKTLTPQNAERLNINRAHCLNNLNLLKKHQQEIQQKVMDVFSDSGEKPLKRDVEAQLYDQFLDPADNSVCETIRNASSEWLANLKPTFRDPRLALLYFRYKARNYPHLLTLDEQRQWRDHCQNKFNENTLHDYVINLEKLVEKHSQDPDKCALLKAIYEYSHSVVGF